MIVKPTLEQIRHVVDRMQSIERQAIESVMFGGFDAEHFADMVSKWPILYACVNDRTRNPAVIGGIYFKLPSVGEAMMFGTDEFGEVVKEVEDASNKAMDALLVKHLRRIEVRSISTHKIAHRWYRNLKLNFEAELKQYGTNGESFYLFSRCRED